MSQPDLVELLAHLDYLVAGPRQTSLSPEQWDDYIRKTLDDLAAEFEHRYSTECIQQMLHTEFSRSDAYPDYNMRRLFGHGSSELILATEMRKQVQDQLMLIRVRGPRKTRQSKSAFVDRTTSRNVKARKSGRLNEKPSTTTVARKRSEVHNKSPQVKIYKSTKPDSSRDHKDKTVTHVLAHGSETNELSCSPIPEASAPRLSNQHVSKSRRIIQDSPSVSPCATDLREETTCDLDASLRINSAYRAMQQELAYYKQRCENAEEKLKGTQQDNRRLRDESKKSEDTLEFLASKNRAIRRLELELEARDHLGKHLALPGLESSVFQPQEISPHFETLKKHFSKIHIINAMQLHSIAGLLGRSSDLDTLIAVSLSNGGSNATNEAVEYPPDVTLSELIRVLTGAAIHLWILEAPIVWHSLMATPILQAYRKHVGLICGNEKLYALDSVAIQSLIDEEPFEDIVVPRLASLHTRRMLAALDPIFDPELKQKTIKKLKASLKGLFHLATRIRFMTIVGNESYESFWPRLASTFDESKMDKISSESERPQIVRLPICPGLRAYSKSEIAVDHGLEHHSASDPTDYVIKALVIT